MMTTTIRRRAAQGFTLIELLIVVIIIAILAAIAIPQFSNTSSDAQESASIANLTTIRSAIELYRVQHNNTYPSVVASSGSAGNCTGGTPAGVAGTGAKDSEQALVDQLTQYSDASGNTCTTAAAGYIYGPYLRAIPVEPITNDKAVTIATTVAGNPATDSTKGWRFVNTTGALQINTTKKARDGTTLLSAK
jgi:prepilin-type N-terminal cleavage/methylation domain-containing protein